MWFEGEDVWPQEGDDALNAFHQDSYRKHALYARSALHLAILRKTLRLLRNLFTTHR